MLHFEQLPEAAFTIGDKGYVISSNFIYEYNPSTDQWTKKSEFGGVARTGAVGFSIGNKGYVGTGTTGFSSCLKDFWEFDPTVNCPLIVSQPEAKINVDNQNSKPGIDTENIVFSHTAYPNPFTHQTTISYYLPMESHVVIQVYDLSGKHTEKLIDKIQDKGTYDIIFDAASLQEGIYYYRIIAGNNKGIGKIILIK